VLVLALDTSTRRGSVALARDGVVLVERVGDASATHGQRLPADLLPALDAARLRLADIDLYGVAAGPGSFTGLRVGVATVQGLAFAHGRRVVPVSSLEAVAHAARESAGGDGLVAAWMDAHRHEVFAALYRRQGDALDAVSGSTVGSPASVLTQWGQWRHEAVWFAGDGALIWRPAIEEFWSGGSHFLEAEPALAGIVARLACERAAQSIAPHAVRPIYVRRPDAELARERRRLRER
jgi:tRNA threonylcarbamoyladenosine biosynthesis protein TsaB